MKSTWPKNDSNLSNLTAINQTLFFVANSLESKQKLWKSDGTATDTRIVKDIRPGPLVVGPLGLTNVGGTLFFRGRRRPRIRAVED
jgi:ELWxxDGT repeat protein